MARSKQINKELAVQIGRAIREHRDAAGLTQAQLAEAIDLQSESISRIEGGKRLPTIEKLTAMAILFRIPPGAFFEYVATVVQPPENDLFAQKISAALDHLPAAGKVFVLEVAQNYAHYHLPEPKRAPKKK